jgi:hypothetical protein
MISPKIHMARIVCKTPLAAEEITAEYEWRGGGAVGGEIPEKEGDSLVSRLNLPAEGNGSVDPSLTVRHW